MPDTAIERETSPAGGRYVVHFEDGTEAEMTYRPAGPNTISIDHTFVPPSHRLDGLAFRLVERAVADARAEEMKIVPVCSYVAAQFRRHPEWTDLRA